MRKVHSQTGGVTILIVLSLLVLLTVTAIGMSRNSLREMMIVGTSRQAASVRQAADTGIEFAILWSDPQNKATGGGGLAFQQKMRWLLENPEHQGEPQSLPAGSNTDMTLLATADQSQFFDLKLLRLGKLPLVLTSVQDERLYNDIWVTRSTGLVKLSGTSGISFQHDKELWVTTPAQTN
ncbi:MAG TPA: hypothetical protein VJ570_11310 [Holophagaceae bacterium]|nr:hypothetical protein [Holophagaceae bacterium]